jgi:hypothetical protein
VEWRGLVIGKLQLLLVGISLVPTSQLDAASLPETRTLKTPKIKSMCAGKLITM